MFLSTAFVSSTAIQQIKHIFLVLGMGIFLGVFSVGWCLYWSGFEKSLKLSHVLLSADTLSSLKNDSQRSLSDKRSDYSSLECYRLSALSGEKERKHIDLTIYHDIYHMIEKEKNIVSVDTSVINAFNEQETLLFLIRAQIEKGSYSFNEEQELQILCKGGYFRIKAARKNADVDTSWIYFYQEGVGKKIDSLIR